MLRQLSPQMTTFDAVTEKVTFGTLTGTVDLVWGG